MDFFLQLVINGVVVGSIYALVALGFVIIYKSSGIINFAQGEFLVLGAYVCLTILSIGRVPLVPAFFLTLVFSAALGVLLERLILRPLIGEPVISVIMVTLGLSSILRAVVQGIWGTDTRPFPPVFPSTPGISVKRIFALSWSIAAIVSAIGGILLGGIRGGVDGSLAFLGLKVVPVTILGGLDSIQGAIVGGVIIGVLENLSGGYLDPLVGGGVKEVAPFVALVLILMVRPYGLFGKVHIERV